MRTLYLDMDGVLADLYGTLSREYGIPYEEVQTHGPHINKMYREWLDSFSCPSEAFLSLPPLYPEDMRKLILDAHEAGVRVEILTHLGNESPNQVEWAKYQWVDTHFHYLVHGGILTKVNCVREASDKTRFAREGALLLDDQLKNVTDFQQAGGRAVLYSAGSHPESLAEVRRLLRID